MITGTGMQLDAAQLERAMSRNAIIRMKGETAGYKFIRLILKSDRYIKNKISGVELLRGVPYVNSKKGNMTDIAIKLESGDVSFELDPATLEYIYDLLDTPHNRKFLATHKDYNIWEIMDQEIKGDIEKIYDEIKASFVRKTPEQPQKENVQKEEVVEIKPPEIPDNLPEIPVVIHEVGAGVVTPGVEQEPEKKLRGRPTRTTIERARVATP
jgi:hypothetical protein